METTPIYSTFCGFALLAFGLYSLAMRRHAALALLPYCSYGVAQTPVPFVHYVGAEFMLVLAAQVALLFDLYHGGSRVHRPPTRRHGRSTTAKALLLTIGMIVIKSALDCGYLGMDQYRYLAVTTLVTQVVSPSLLLLLAVAAYSPEEAAGQFFAGCAMTSGIWLAFGLVGGILSGDLFMTGRLCLHRTGTIDSVRLVPMFLFGIVYRYLMKPRLSRGIAAGAATLTCSAILFLNGTRQTSLCCLTALCLLAFKIKRIRRPALVATLATALLALCVIGSSLADRAGMDIPLLERLDVSQMRHDGRLEVNWPEAVEATLREPVFGNGFREFGREITKRNDFTGEDYAQKDTAHGIIMDVFVDHGLIIGGIFLVLCLLNTTAEIRTYARSPLNARTALSAFYVCTMLAMFFSYPIWDAFPVIALHILLWRPLRMGAKTLPARPQERKSSLSVEGAGHAFP